MESTNKIGIGITSRNRPELILECVENIKKYSKDHFLVIIDDASELNVRSLLGYVPNTRVIRFDKQQGVAIGKNKCLEELKLFDYVFLFDDDAWPIKYGWEDMYIEASKKTGCHHFCHIWDYNLDGSKSYFKRLDEYVDMDVEVETPGYPIIFTKSDLLGEVNMAKSRHGIDCRIGSKLNKTVNYHVNSYHHAGGVLMFYTRHCIEKVGGFNLNYGVYGNEHMGLTNRIFNAGLNPFGKYLDVENSTDYIFAKDREVFHDSVLDKDFRESSAANSYKLLEKEMKEDSFYCYCSFKCSCKSDK